MNTRRIIKAARTARPEPVAFTNRLQKKNLMAAVAVAAAAIRGHSLAAPAVTLLLARVALQAAQTVAEAIRTPAGLSPMQNPAQAVAAVVVALMHTKTPMIKLLTGGPRGQTAAAAWLPFGCT